MGDKILKNNSGSNAGVNEMLISGTQALVQATLIQKERDDFLERVKAGLENIENTSDYFYEEECLFVNDEIMNYSRLEKQDDGVYRVVGMALMNTEGKLWRNVERITKVEVKK